MKSILSMMFFLASLILLQGCASTQPSADRCDASAKPVYSESQRGTYCEARPHFENFRI